jgi:hypothetical protein
VLNSNHYPTLWDPQQLFFHLAVWAGVPAIVMAVAVALLGIYKSIQSWIGFGKSTVLATNIARAKFRSWTTGQQRAVVRLVVFSVLAVALSYMLAVIVNAVIQLIAVNPNAVFSMKGVVDRVGITPWPLAAVWTVIGGVFGIGALGLACIADLRGVQKFVTSMGGVVWIAAWLVGLGLAADAVMMCLGLLLNAASHSSLSDSPPLPLLVTVAVTGVLSLALAQLLPRLRAATAEAFAPSQSSSW